MNCSHKMVKFIEYGSKGMCQAEGSVELPAAEFEALHAEFPGFIAISKYFRRQDEPSLYSMVNDVVKAIGSEQKGHATLNKGKEFRLFFADYFKTKGLRISSLHFDQTNNARGPQNHAANCGPAFYALVTVLPAFVAAMQAKAGNSNLLWDAIIAAKENMLVCAQAAVKYVLWHLVFAPYRHGGALSLDRYREQSVHSNAASMNWSETIPCMSARAQPICCLSSCVRCHPIRVRISLVDWSRLLEPLWSGPDGGAGRRPGVREQLEPSGRSVGHRLGPGRPPPCLPHKLKLLNASDGRKFSIRHRSFTVRIF
eukprot:SAG31_NODE_259_length_18917_cov_28.559677_16_plen_312_part_00